MRREFEDMGAQLDGVETRSVADVDDMQPLPPVNAYDDGPTKPAPEARASRFFPASDLFGKDIPERRWVVPGLIPSNTVTILGGDGGTGKSLIALQLSVAIATGQKWLDRDTIGGRVIYVSAEDDTDEIHRRMADISRATDTPLDQITDLSLRSLAGEDALLALCDARSGILHPTPLFDEFQRHVAEVEPAVIVLDTLADLFPGNENDRAQARQFIGLLRGIAIQFDCAVVLLSHPSLTGLNSGSGSSGSTAWNNSVRSRLYFSRVTDEGYEQDPDLRVLKTMKSNYGQVGGEINVKWRDGVFIPIEDETQLDQIASSAKAERVFLELLTQFEAQGRRLNHAGGPNYAPAVFSAHPHAEGVTRKAFHLAMETLLAKSEIVVVENGPPSRRTTFLRVSS